MLRYVRHVDTGSDGAELTDDKNIKRKRRFIEGLYNINAPRTLSTTVQCLLMDYCIAVN